MTELAITILGRPVSKKNSKRFIKRGNRKFLVPSEAYEVFLQDALRQLRYVPEKFEGPVRIDYVFARKGKLSQDVDNAMASINDVLQEAGIIDDDKNILEGSFGVVVGWKSWQTNIKITKL